ncbi:MAG TPA: DUF692 domain-containing protein [Acetobacteraceae bacterium]|nr:DUF692 domain-containing protein [Acetobacteraceae bacterium]
MRATGGRAGLPAGIGLRAPHLREIMGRPAATGFLEVHAENFMHNAPARAALLRLRETYPVSLHGVALSLGGAEALDRDHLARLRDLVTLLEPILVSEHMAWSALDGVYLNDLLPLPCTGEALAVMVAHVDEVQQVLRRRILIENPSVYLRFENAAMPEPVFLAELARRTGCGLLCDVNNIHVSAHNVGHDVAAYVEALPAAAVEEIHLAGHAARPVGGTTLLIDDHASRVADPVWRLYEQAIARFGPTPTLIEWDNDIPPLDVLLDEAAKADKVAAGAAGGAHAAAA